MRNTYRGRLRISLSGPEHRRTRSVGCPVDGNRAWQDLIDHDGIDRGQLGLDRRSFDPAKGNVTVNSRQRVIAAINHLPHDRVPVDLGAHGATGLTVSAYGRLREALEIPAAAVRVVDAGQMLAQVELAVVEALGLDVVGVCPGGGFVHGWQDWTTPDGVEVKMPADIELARREDGGWDNLVGGVRSGIMPAGGHYFDSVEYPQWPIVDLDVLTDEVLRDLETRARAYRTGTVLAIILNTPCAISNSTNPDFMCALLLEKEEAHERLEQWADSIVVFLGKILDAVKDYVDIVAFSGDAGSQNAPLFGPELYSEMIVPHMRKVMRYVHESSSLKCFLHSCGSVYRLIDSFIEMGVDILNPLQLSAADMEPERLVKEFGGRIVFWGGGCDTQHVLPYGSEDDVREEVAGRMAVYSTVEGFVFSQVHNVQPDVPVGNILAMMDEVRVRKAYTS